MFSNTLLQQKHCIHLLQEKCLGFYIGYVRDNVVIKTNCLRTSPFWTQQLRSVIGSSKIPEVMDSP